MEKARVGGKETFWGDGNCGNSVQAPLNTAFVMPHPSKLVSNKKERFKCKSLTWNFEYTLWKCGYSENLVSTRQ